MSKPRVKRPAIDPGATAPSPPAAPESSPIRPEERALGPAIAGVPVRLSGGGEWLLARASMRMTPAFRVLRDRLWDEWATAGKLPVGLVQATAVCLLQVNYRLATDEAARLVVMTDPAQILDAVLDATVNVQVSSRQWSAWAASALWANGIDPEKVPGEALLDTLDQLIRTGRAAHPAEWTDAGLAAAKFADMRALATALAAKEV